jgi:hypothetical protein
VEEWVEEGMHHVLGEASHILEPGGKGSHVMDAVIVGKVQKSVFLVDGFTREDAKVIVRTDGILDHLLEISLRGFTTTLPG